jgi:hypothetical protein
MELGKLLIDFVGRLDEVPGHENRTSVEAYFDIRAGVMASPTK